MKIFSWFFPCANFFVHTLAFVKLVAFHFFQYSMRHEPKIKSSINESILMLINKHKLKST